MLPKTVKVMTGMVMPRVITIILMETMEIVHMMTTVTLMALLLKLLRVNTIRWEPSGSLSFRSAIISIH